MRKYKCLIGNSEGEERYNEAKTIFQGMRVKSFLWLTEGISLQFKKPKGMSRGYIVVKLKKIKDKGKVLKAVRGKGILSSKDPLLELQLTFQMKQWKLKEKWNGFFNVMKGETMPTRIYSFSDFVCLQTFLFYLHF